MNLRSAFLLLAVALAACAPAPPPPPEPPAAADAATLRAAFSALPGAVVGTEEALTVSYPGETLFAVGAALPLPGGTAVLDPLAALLLTHSGVRGSAVVRARTGISADYDEALADKRAELLERYFRNRGIPGERLDFRAEGGDGAPLSLVLEGAPQPASASSSSPEKR